MPKGKKTSDSKIETLKTILALDIDKPASIIARSMGMPETTVRKLRAEILNDIEFTEYITEQKKIAREKGMGIVCSLLEKLGSDDIIMQMTTREALGAVKIIVEALSTIEGNNLIIGNESTTTVERSITVREKVTSNAVIPSITDDNTNTTL